MCLLYNKAFPFLQALLLRRTLYTWSSPPPPHCSTTALTSSTIYPICPVLHHSLHHSLDGYGGSKVWGEEHQFDYRCYSYLMVPQAHTTPIQTQIRRLYLQLLRLFILRTLSWRKRRLPHCHENGDYGGRWA